MEIPELKKEEYMKQQSASSWPSSKYNYEIHMKMLEEIERSASDIRKRYYQLYGEEAVKKYEGEIKEINHE